tara:strand:- start:176 stop:460 length:285 start_codon:yes stop_codon:yes gene_type:complete
MEQSNKNPIDLKAHLIKAMGNDVSGWEVYNAIQSATLEIIVKKEKDLSFSETQNLLQTEISLVVALTIKLCHENSQKVFDGLVDESRKKIDRLL